MSNTDISVITICGLIEGIALGSVAYNTALPPMDALVRKLSNTSLSNRYLAIFEISRGRAAAC